MTLYQQCEQLLDELEQVLEACDLLQSEPPSPKRLASREPFAVDTLDCHEWLQWIFIPKMRALVVARQPLPRNFEIAPYVEEAMKEQQGATAVVKVTYRIDALLTQ